MRDLVMLSRELEKGAVGSAFVTRNADEIKKLGIAQIRGKIDAVDGIGMWSSQASPGSIGEASASGSYRAHRKSRSTPPLLSVVACSRLVTSSGYFWFSVRMLMSTKTIGKQINPNVMLERLLN